MALLFKKWGIMVALYWGIMMTLRASKWGINVALDMATEPPFYRRLASLSQAALIHRELVNFSVDDAFYQWAIALRVEQFYWQTLTDMRLEPRWNPDLASASQMKADFFGRIFSAAKKNEKNIQESELHSLILGEQPGSLLSHCVLPHSCLPGPLEGGGDRSIALPSELSETIKAQLTSDEVEPLSFVALVNSALIFPVNSDQVELAVKALKLGNYRLSNIQEKSQLLGILNGLATVAAAGRSVVLANELRFLLRRYRRDAQYGFSIEEAMKIVLVASASRENLNEWREFAGNCLTELAFGELEGNEGNILHSHLMCLCHAVPELWVTCSKADAALRAYNESRHSG